MALDSTKIIKGQELMLFYNNKSLAWATSHSLNLSGNTTSISTKDHGLFDATKLNSVSWEITAENLYSDDAFDTMFDLMMQTEELTVCFGHYSENSGIAGAQLDGESWTQSSTKSVYQGKGYITSLTANAPNGDNATMSITFSGVGELKRLTDNA